VAWSVINPLSLAMDPRLETGCSGATGQKVGARVIIYDIGDQRDALL
jgi:hypothetical protein